MILTVIQVWLISDDKLVAYTSGDCDCGNDGDGGDDVDVDVDVVGEDKRSNEDLDHRLSNVFSVVEGACILSDETRQYTRDKIPPRRKRERGK